MIYILTGPIRAGKTTALLNWIKDRNDVDGLLCPDNEMGKRYFLKVASKKTLVLEIPTEDTIKAEDTTFIGPFKFFKSAFQKANDFLLHSNEEGDFPYVIIDELGKLELKNEGLHASAKTLTPQYVKNESLHLILVVRDYLLDAIVAHYNISEYQLLKKEDLAKKSFT